MINRNEVLKHILEKYNTSAEYLWAKTPNFAVFRHKHNRKWFCAIVDVTADKLGMSGNNLVDALLLKCDPLMIGSLISQQGILPGYHMNKEHWITVVLDGTVDTQQIWALVDLSYDLTR